MPLNRGFFERLLVLNRLLRKTTPRYSSSQDLLSAVNENMQERYDQEEGISLRTLQDDLKYMRKTYNAPIPGRGPYNYTDLEYNLIRVMLADEYSPDRGQLLKLYQAFLVFRQYDFFSVSKEVWALVEDLEAEFERNNLDIKGYVQFDINRQVKGLEFIDPLYEAIIAHQKVKVSYQPFEEDRSMAFVVDPYFLREYSNRWYLVGFDNSHHYKPINLALDRMLDVELQNERISRPPFNIDTYFDNVIGVTKNPPAVEVTFRATPRQAQYLKTKPLHTTMAVESEGTKGVVFRMQVHLNYELEQNLLKLGKEVEVLAPDELRQKMWEHANAMAHAYRPT